MIPLALVTSIFFIDYLWTLLKLKHTWTNMDGEFMYYSGLIYKLKKIHNPNVCSLFVESHVKKKNHEGTVRNLM
jgi:hypothetical protein